jgi:hypothetical protein
MSIFKKSLFFAITLVLIRLGLSFVPAQSIPGYDKPVKLIELITISDISVILTGAFFTIGIILAGTMADFKESEKIPGEIASNLESIEDHLLLAIHLSKQRKSNTPIDTRYIYNSLVELSNATLEWFKSSDKHSKTIFDAIRKGNELTYFIANQEGGRDVLRGLQEGLNQLRKNVNRAYYISRTNFLTPVFYLLLIIVSCLLIILTICKFNSSFAGYFVTGIGTFIFIYLLQLIRGLDDPFDFERDDVKVSLLPLERFKDRIHDSFYKNNLDEINA